MCDGGLVSDWGNKLSFDVVEIIISENDLKDKDRVQYDKALLFQHEEDGIVIISRRTLYPDIFLDEGNDMVPDGETVYCLCMCETEIPLGRF